MTAECTESRFHSHDTEMTGRLSAQVQKVSSLAGILEYREDKFLSVTRYKLKEKKKKKAINFNGVTLDLHHYS